MLKLKEIHVKNFKSLKDCKIELGNLNVLVGKNGSGKTNFVDLFVLLKKIYDSRELNPFRAWWGYQNVVYGRKEDLDIEVKFLFDYFNYSVEFETIFNGRGGKFEFVSEKLKIDGLVELILEGGFLKIKYDERFYPKLAQIAEKLRGEIVERELFWGGRISEKYRHLPTEKFSETLREQLIPTNSKTLMDLRFTGHFAFSSPKLRETGSFVVRIFIEENNSALLIEPVTPIEKEKKPPWIRKSLIESILGDLRSFISKILVLKVNVNEAKRPREHRKESWLEEDGSNLHSLLYTMFLDRNQLPERILNNLQLSFPEIIFRPFITEDGRVYFKMLEDNLELPPLSVADGIYKFLTILTAIELKPSILVVDEIENSLYYEVLQRLMDAIKYSEICAIITTHSPIVVDITDPKDLVLVEKIAGGTKFRRVENPEELKKKLSEAGLTFSEGWLFGKI